MSLDNLNEDYEKGFTNGLENIEKSNYEGLLSSEVSLNWHKDRLSEKQDNLNNIQAELKRTQADSVLLFNKIQENQKVFNEKQDLVEGLNKKNEIAQQKIEDWEKDKKEKRSPYAFLAGFIYLLAGAAFIAGDLIISHEIVAYALNIRNNFEAWAFAIGLASLSILLKPAYERLVEQPYLTNYNEKTKKIYGYFQTGLLVICIGTLTVLGWFRYEAYRTDKLKEGINREIKSLQLEATPIDPTQAVNNSELVKKIDEKLKAYQQLNIELVNSNWALLSFILSGVLFAIAGAICLGIAFPILQSYWQRWFEANASIRALKKQIRKNEKILPELKKDWFDVQSKLDAQNHEFNLLPNLEELKSEKLTIQQEIVEIQDKILLLIESARISNYNDGYQSGNMDRTNMTDDEFEEYRKRNIEKLKSGFGAQSEKSPKVYRNNGLRPHQALRKAITDGINEN